MFSWNVCYHNYFQGEKLYSGLFYKYLYNDTILHISKHIEPLRAIFLIYIEVKAVKTTVLTNI